MNVYECMNVVSYNHIIQFYLQFSASPQKKAGG